MVEYQVVFRCYAGVGVLITPAKDYDDAEKIVKFIIDGDIVILKTSKV